MTAAESLGASSGRCCLVTGAYGFIGAAVVQALLRAGWRVVGAGRDVGFGRRLVPGIDWVHSDFNHDVDAQVWRERLAGVDAVVNCVGILQTAGGDNARRVHVDAPAALFKGAEQAGVRRLIHVSAMSAEDHIDTEYARTKRAAERLLEEVGINWLIIKPSLVIGQGSYGGTSMIRGLAGLPLVTPLPEGGEQVFQPIAMADLATGIARLAKADAPARATLYAPGPEVVTLEEIVTRTRGWLGFKPARELAIGRRMTRALLKFGDLWVALGNRTPFCTTAFRQMAFDEFVEPGPFAAATGLELKTLGQTFSDMPSTLQDRLHARVAFPLTALRLAVALVWIGSGIVALLPHGFGAAADLLAGAGIDGALARVLVAVTAVADIALGALFLVDRFVRRAGALQIALAVGYLAALSVLAPVLWADPLGPLLKVVPLIAATAVVMALGEER